MPFIGALTAAAADTAAGGSVVGFSNAGKSNGDLCCCRACALWGKEKEADEEEEKKAEADEEEEEEEDKEEDEEEEEAEEAAAAADDDEVVGAITVANTDLSSFFSSLHTGKVSVPRAWAALTLGVVRADDGVARVCVTVPRVRVTGGRAMGSGDNCNTPLLLPLAPVGRDADDASDRGRTTVDAVFVVVVGVAFAVPDCGGVEDSPTCSSGRSTTRWV
jgi:hypothetical protein